MGVTALIVAASSGRKESVELLLKYGADPRTECTEVCVYIVRHDTIYFDELVQLSISVRS